MPAVVKQKKKKNKRQKESLYNSGESDDIKEIAHLLYTYYNKQKYK